MTENEKYLFTNVENGEDLTFEFNGRRFHLEHNKICSLSEEVREHVRSCLMRIYPNKIPTYKHRFELEKVND